MFSMANEAVLIVETEHPVNFTCANGTGIEKGTLCKIADLMTASASLAAGDVLAGIAGAEKIASDGTTKVPIFMGGIFKMTASGTVPVGRAVSSASITAWPNYVCAAPVTVSGSAILGHALETAAAGDTFLVRVNVGAGGNQIS